ncbi:MAG: hypothetical protein IPP46_14240 [Bacteroidetes bacterium]|nr:hypothetical protein [Bacteroidota bacterium]
MVYIPALVGSRPVFGDGDGTTESVNALHYSDNLATNQFCASGSVTLTGLMT